MGVALDPSLFTNDPNVAARPSALKFDPVKRDFVLDTSTGLYVAAHPVDAWVEFTLHFLKNRLRSAPDVGWTIDKIEDWFGKRGAQNADQAARAALATGIRSGDIDYKGLQYQATAAGPACVVRYFNLRTLPKPKTPTALHLQP